ncbi:ribbon-helix-helix domain-containing protein [Tardiphaga sp.]|uniref:ribbon-helix-helix domain-containing protein n=1 Tax=Tardiphaga sp. TaxID=1926292 RepID=UPI00261EE4DC|nr:ribbon-helix-helix domain-containing protein [Tardiphaga sp.]MDB5616622.1 aryl-sulfate sulfotransferase [Tardiphaga sp.]
MPEFEERSIRPQKTCESSVAKRSVVVDNHKTSVSIEDEFWTSLKDIAASRKQTLSELLSEIDGSRTRGNLSSAIRLFVLAHYKKLESDRQQPVPLS